MPQVFKRKWMAKDGRERTSRVWYCRFQINGRDYLHSTGTSSFAEAKAEMERMRLAAREGATLDRATKQFREAVKELPEEQRTEARIDVAKILFWELQNVLKALSDEKHKAMRKTFSKQLMQGIGEKLAIADIWEAWLQHPNTGSPIPKTLEGYQGQWKRFRIWAKSKGIEYLHEATPGHAEKYAADLWGSGISPRTFNAHIKILKSLFKVLRRVASVELVNPFEDIRLRDSATAPWP